MYSKILYKMGHPASNMYFNDLDSPEREIRTIEICTIFTTIRNFRAFLCRKSGNFELCQKILQVSVVLMFSPLELICTQLVSKKSFLDWQSQLTKLTNENTLEGKNKQNNCLWSDFYRILNFRALFSHLFRTE